mmetsp:Transcript_8018/g.18602  ORF Transcript_8018/g.18602 Transcript_8018/m.18602 type:complete len:260 (+) Transcript_8018:75-854(+)
MIIKTKKYKLPTSTYMQLGMKTIVREQWWVLLIALAVMSVTFFIKSIWFIIGASVALLLYFLFWVVQFYGITYLEQNKLLFERLRYEISSQQIIIQLSSKQGMPITWKQVKRATKGKDYFLLVISRAHLVHLPYKIFNSTHEIKFLETILKRKALLQRKYMKACAKERIAYRLALSVQHCIECMQDFFCIGQCFLYKGRGIRKGYIFTIYFLNRCVEIVENMFLHLVGDLGGNRPQWPGFFDKNKAVGFLHRMDDSSHV